MISETKIKKILYRLNTLEALAEGIIHETTILRRELSGVAPDNSPKGLSDDEVVRIRAKRKISQLRKRKNE